MSTIRRYTIVHDATGMSIMLDVDLSKLTAELADEINRFWIEWEWRLDTHDGDVIAVVIKLAAQRFLALLLEDEDSRWAQHEFDRSEGWPPHGAHGIKLVDCDGLPVLDLDELSIIESVVV
ncbi:MAG TPA: DUF2528 family protein [Tahibacter sp.]|uniref:DUF2528 family protein n=1 Tax=Tahibacter sp. TaxID=2056211 RepID=UPI002C516AAB|nr:DUF2528 family protein [Tahibacter sp.]HSX60232.1 DUF2528 family protein [Tahibacter sp.]